MIGPNRQTDLFKHNLIEGGCSLHQANVLFKENLLSFNPIGKEEYEGFEIEELQFLKSLYFDSGLPINIVTAMLSKLEKPYSYSFKQTYWDYGEQTWKEIPPDIEDYIDENYKEIILNKFDEFLEAIDNDDIEELTNIKSSISNRLKLIKND